MQGAYSVRKTTNEILNKRKDATNGREPDTFDTQCEQQLSKSKHVSPQELDGGVKPRVG